MIFLYSFDKKEKARHSFYELRQVFIDWNYKEFQSDDFKVQEKKVDQFINEHSAAVQAVEN